MSVISDLIKRLSSAYKRESTDNNYKILEIPASEFDIVEIEIGNVKDAHFVDSAIGISLDRIGSLLKVIRSEGESDASYRARIKSEVPNFVGGGTIESIEKGLAILPGEVTIIEDFPAKPAHFAVDIDLSGETGGPLPIDDVNIRIDKTRGAGISYDLEYNSTFVWDSNIEGQRWDEGYWGNV